MTPDPRIERLRELGATIGDDVYFGLDVYIEDWFAPLLTIESGVVVSRGVTILLHDSSLNNVADAPLLLGEVLLRERCYLGVNVTVLCGVEVGAGALVGACSLVTKDVPAGAVAYGTPARVAGDVQQLAERYADRPTSAARHAFVEAPPWRDRDEASHAALHGKIDAIIESMRDTEVNR